MMRQVKVPWTLREQQATATLPYRPKMRVEVIMDPATYRVFAMLRSKVMDGDGKLLLEGEALHKALDEMHNLVEITYMMDGQVVEAPPVEVVVDANARTEALAAAERLEADGWKIPDRVKNAVAAGQTSILDSSTPLASEAHARTDDPWTSHAAARSLTADELRETQMAVLQCFREHGPMHHEEFLSVYERDSQERGWPRQSVSGLRTRASELVDGGMLRNSGRTVELPSGRSSIVWEVAR
jgi:hypothetical protein